MPNSIDHFALAEAGYLCGAVSHFCQNVVGVLPGRGDRSFVAALRAGELHRCRGRAKCAALAVVNLNEAASGDVYWICDGCLGRMDRRPHDVFTLKTCSNFLAVHLEKSLLKIVHEFEAVNYATIDVGETFVRTHVRPAGHAK